MRVVGGEFGGRRLVAPPGKATRPTADRVREAVFNILGPPPPGAQVLDLCAGAGTLGIEALSRGAAFATFVDSARAATATIRQNLASLGISGRARVLETDALRALRRFSQKPPAPFAWIFIDPPYRSDLGIKLLDRLGQNPLVSPDGIIIVEHDRQNPLKLATGCLLRTDHRRYGQTELSFYRPLADKSPS